MKPAQAKASLTLSLQVTPSFCTQQSPSSRSFAKLRTVLIDEHASSATSLARASESRTFFSKACQIAIFVVSRSVHITPESEQGVRPVVPRCFVPYLCSCLGPDSTQCESLVPNWLHHGIGHTVGVTSGPPSHPLDVFPLRIYLTIRVNRL